MTKPAVFRPGTEHVDARCAGVVYGDIGTSPLYTLRQRCSGPAAPPRRSNRHVVADCLDLSITTSLKYVTVVMRADNDGEGGILALMSLLGIKHGERIVALRSVFWARLCFTAMRH